MFFKFTKLCQMEIKLITLAVVAVELTLVLVSHCHTVFCELEQKQQKMDWLHEPSPVQYALN